MAESAQTSPRTLDVGCGRGELGLAQSERGEFVVAIDIDRGRLIQAARRAAGASARMMFVLADAARLPFRDAVFDRAMCFEVLEHVPDPARTLTEVRRVVRTGSELELSVPTWFTERFFCALWPDWLAVCTHRRIFRRRELVGLLRECGFDVEREEGRHFYWTYYWFFHCLARTPHDGTGHTNTHRDLTRLLEGVWRWCESLPMWRVVVRWGNRVLPKSTYFRCRTR